MKEKDGIGRARTNLRFDIILVIIFCLITFGIWASMMPLTIRFSGYDTLTHSLGQISGLIGMVLFSLALVLTTKSKMVENSAGGLDKVYRLHQDIGALAFVLLLVHPLLLVLKYIPGNWAQAAIYLWPSQSWAVNFGIISLTMMIILLAMTFYVTMKYLDWKVSHKLLGIAFAAGILHSFLITTDISRSPYLKLWMVIVCAIGLIAHIYGSYLIKILKRQYKYKVVKIEQNGKFNTVLLSPIKKDLKYRAGQFAFLKFKTNNTDLNEAHPFTIASSPGSLPDGQIRFVIKGLGDFTSRLSEIKPGTIAKIDGPYGRFDYTKYNTDQVWIAGGVGITPFLSFAQALLKSGFKKKITLYYCTRDMSEQVHYDELTSAADASKNFKIIQFCSDTKGQLTAQVINDTTGIKNKDIFICGPPPMMHALKAQLLKLGVKKSYIHMEDFGFK
jgi:predicted ferric reductase